MTMETINDEPVDNKDDCQCLLCQKRRSGSSVHLNNPQQIGLYLGVLISCSAVDVIDATVAISAVLTDLLRTAPEAKREEIARSTTSSILMDVLTPITAPAHHAGAGHA